jgi:hypothetical protein
MSSEELTLNLVCHGQCYTYLQRRFTSYFQGTVAKSGTSEFLTKADSEDTTGGGNLIGAFGVGFYSR